MRFLIFILILASQLSPVFVDGEMPVGIIDGKNAVFSLAIAPNPPSSLRLDRNGLLQSNIDFTLSTRFIRFYPAAIPQIGDKLHASYRH